MILCKVCSGAGDEGIWRKFGIVVLTLILHVVLALPFLYTFAVSDTFQKPQPSANVVVYLQLDTLVSQFKSPKETAEKKDLISASKPQYPSSQKTPAEMAGESGVVYFDSKQVDRRALPFSAPDPAALNGIAVTGYLSIKVRVYIDDAGKVVRVQALNPNDDTHLIRKIEGMIRETSFMPARRMGSDVASYQDLEFNISEVGN
jgi:hypothetical protein